MTITEDTTTIAPLQDEEEPTTEVVTPAPGDAEQEPEGVEETLRTIVAVSLPVIAAAVMVGGVFSGISPRFYAAIAGLLGLALAFGVARLKSNNLPLTFGLILAGVFGIGMVVLLPTNAGDIFSIQDLVSDARKDRSVLRPPVDFSGGWKAISGWLMGILGFAVGWVAITLRRPALALLLPLPLAAFAGISVPESAQVASGIAVLVLFALGLGLLASEQSAGEDGTRPPMAYEIRKAVRAIPLLALVVVALYALSQTNILFPDQLFDPAQEPQKPKPQPLSEARERVLFEVTDTELTGPWRQGVLDVYDGKDWRLPPFAASQVENVPDDGVVDEDFQPSLEATITIRGLAGAVLPDLPNTVGVTYRGRDLAFDSRTGSLRFVNGQADPGFTYKVFAASFPTETDLRGVVDQVPASIRQFACIGLKPAENCQAPEPPPAIQGLIEEAPTDSKYDQFSYVFQWFLQNVTVTGQGQPVSITPDRVEDMINGSKKGSPFEIVAAQAIVARYLGLPSRLAYGFDGGERINDALHVKPADGIAFVEVYFPGFKWLPFIGTPQKAEPTVGSDPSDQRTDPGILPSDDIAVQVFLPTVVPPDSVFAKQVATVVLVAIPIILLLLLLYVTYPAVRKARLRARRRELALNSGTRARIALAYSEWRDVATDYGFYYPTDTPLMYLDRFIEDEEHAELAWLTTRALWGDLQDETNPMLASVAEELSRSLRRRLGSAQPGTVRLVAAVSRLSLRTPYAPEFDERSRSPRRRRKEAARVPEPVA